MTGNKRANDWHPTARFFVVLQEQRDEELLQNDNDLEGDSHENTIPAKAGIQPSSICTWIPTSVGMVRIIFILHGATEKWHGRLLREAEEPAMTDRGREVQNGLLLARCLLMKTRT